MMWNFFLKLQALFFLCLLTPLHATTLKNCQIILTNLNEMDHLPSYRTDAGLEVEGNAKKYLEIGLSSRNGKLSGLISTKQAKQALEKWANSVEGKEILSHFKKENAEDLPFQPLAQSPIVNHLLQLEAMKRFPLHHDPTTVTDEEIVASFKSNRAIDGLAMLSKAQIITKEKPFSFFDTTVPPHSQTILNMNPHVSSRVEYLASDELKYVLKGKGVHSVEFHVRGKKGYFSPGEALKSTWALEGLSNKSGTNPHLHLIADIPYKALTQWDPIFVESAALADFARRTELAFQFHHILTYGNIAEVRMGYSGLSSPHKGDTFKRFFNDLKLLQKDPTKAPQLGDKYKLGYVGLHFDDKYESEEVLGFQIRSIKFEEKENSINLVDATHARLASDTYGIKRERLQDWAEIKPPSNKILAFIANRLGTKKSEQATSTVWQKKFDQSYYNHPWEVLVQRTPISIRRKLYEKMEKTNQTLLEMLITRTTPQNIHTDSQVPLAGAIKKAKNLELKMLIHDWKNDPLFFDNAEMLSRIEKLQLEALEQLRKEAFDTPEEVVKQFLIDSKIAESVFHSMGLSMKVKMRELSPVKE